MTPGRASLEVVDAGVWLGATRVIDGVSMEVEAGRIVGLVGPNGAGKTTLLDAVSGLVPLRRGTVRLAGRDVSGLSPHRRARLGLARTFQNLELFDDLTAEENLAVAAHPTAIGRRSVRRATPGPGGDGGSERVGALSHGRRKDVALNRALAANPRVVLLDEPAAGLDGAGRAGLVRRLRGLASAGLALVMADHDVDLVMSVCDEVYVLDFGRLIARGAPEQVRSEPAVIAAYLGTQRAEPAPARPAPRGEPVIRARGLVAGYGGAPALDGLDFDVRAGEVVALLGPNGAGKTTTLRALSGLLEPAGGELRVLGARRSAPERLARLGLAHVPQDRAVLAGLTVAENLRLAGRRAAGGRQALEAFPSLVPLLDRRAGRLSGGEQQLLALARALATEPRALLIDELSLGLAPGAARQALQAVRSLAGSGVACVVAEQHPVLAFDVADRAVVLVAGRCVFEGPASALVARPELLRTAYLGGA